MVNLNWEENKESVIEILNEYFGLGRTEIQKYIAENFSDSDIRQRISDRQKLVAVIKALSPYLVKPAYDGITPEENLAQRIKSGEAILQNPKFSEEESVEQIYNRLNRLFGSISEKGIDIYKTIYTGSLTSGNLGTVVDPKTKKKIPYETPDRDFDNIYYNLKKTLRLTTEETNAIIEKCASTIISKVYASNIPALYNRMMFLCTYDEDRNTNYFFFRYDKEFKTETDRSKKKSKMLDGGLINCPTIFSCKPSNVERAFNYVASRIPEELVEEDYLRFQAQGNESMTRYWCKYYIMSRWINNNFSLLTINVPKMIERENAIKYLQDSLNDRWYYDERRTNYDFSFLFHRPASISIMNTIDVNDIATNAKENIKILERYVGEKATSDYIEKNHYMLAMDNYKFRSLLGRISAHDHENPEEPYMERYLMLGKSLFGSKHCIKFDVDKTFETLAKMEKIQTLDVERMSDWEKVSKFVEIFCNNDKTIVSHIQRLYHEKLKKDGRGGTVLRKHIRTLLINNGGWDEIIKDRKRTMTITTEVNSIIDKRFAVEQVERTDDFYADITNLQAKEDAFSDEIKAVLATIRKAYSDKSEKLVKKYTDIDKLYEQTMAFLEKTCFDDKEPISTLIEEELRRPFVDALKRHSDKENKDVSEQMSLFGGKRVAVEAPDRMYKPLKKLSQAISVDSTSKVELDTIQIVKSKGDGK